MYASEQTQAAATAYFLPQAIAADRSATPTANPSSSMAPETKTYRCSYEVAYETDSDAALGEDVLAWLQFGRRPDVRTGPEVDPRRVHVPLPQVGGPRLAEVWRSRTPVEHGWSDGFGYAHNGEVLFGQLHLQEHEIANLDRATTRGYVHIDLLLRRLGYPCWLRTWNFVSHINHGVGDAERYRQFSQGRYNALALKPGFEAQLPAATAIGTDGGGMTLCFLAARDAGEQIENPRQVSAFRYPAAYGPRSPSFSRANLKHWADRLHLFVSGTASVVGYQSLHPGDPLAQLEETVRNFDALLQQAARHEPAAGPFHPAVIKIYLRPGLAVPALLQRARQLFGATVPLLCLTGEICRGDLLIEIEGVYVALPRAVSEGALP